MTRSTAAMAIAADYADALMTARRAKFWLFLALLVFLVVQVAVFLLARFDVLSLHDADSAATTTGVVARAAAPAAAGLADAAAPDTEASAGDRSASACDPVTPPADPAATQPTTSPAATTLAEPAAPAATSPPPADPARPASSSTPAPPKGLAAGEALRYAIPVMNFLGIVLAVALSTVLLLLTTIMLVGRLVGVSHVTSAFIWSVLLVLFLFPWQAFLISDGRYPVRGGAASSAHAANLPEQPAFKIPGALYTYPELKQDHKFPDRPLKEAVLKWARFVAFPLVTLILLVVVQSKSGKGLKYALGEADIHVDAGREPLV